LICTAFPPTTLTLIPQRAGQFKQEVEIQFPLTSLVSPGWTAGAESDCLWIPTAPTESPAIAVSFRNFLRLNLEQRLRFPSAFEIQSSISLFAPISPDKKIKNKFQALDLAPK
jgi:hypothetical protein